MGSVFRLNAAAKSVLTDLAGGDRHTDGGSAHAEAPSASPWNGGHCRRIMTPSRSSTLASRLRKLALGRFASPAKCSGLTHHRLGRDVLGRRSRGGALRRRRGRWRGIGEEGRREHCKRHRRDGEQKCALDLTGSGNNDALGASFAIKAMVTVHIPPPFKRRGLRGLWAG